MGCHTVLSVLIVFVLPLCEDLFCEAMTMNSVILPQESGGGASQALSHLRSKRSWVWNQFFVLEEHIMRTTSYWISDGQVRYILSGEGAVSIFTIDENTGDIHATKRLDREQQAYYTLRAQARDRNTDLLIEPESYFIIKVQDINDNEPTFLDGPYIGRVAEMSPVGTSVVTVVATDPDDPTYGNSARLVYSIIQGQQYFSVEPNTGVVRTVQADMDREVQDCFLLIVQAKDMIGQMGGLSGTTSVTVMLTDVNDNPPRFPHSNYQFSVPESTLVSRVVAKIKALDLDLGPNAEMDYRILDKDGLGNFRILTDPNTQEGLIILQKTLDFETKPNYTFRVEASNHNVDMRFLSMGPFVDVATVRLLVQNVDEPPVFLSPVSHMVISEAAAVGSHVGIVSAQDPDNTKSPVRYSIDRKSDVDCYFKIDNLLSVVLVSLMDVNDNAPNFTIEYQMFVCENSKPGQLIQTVSAVDRDEPENGHHLFFSLTTEASEKLNFTLRDNQGTSHLN
uniref:Cadherin-7-like n=1 Tax=Echeneis naucrates TaxID=173247 RepID=A0A665TBC5_ECHNA